MHHAIHETHERARCKERSNQSRLFPQLLRPRRHWLRPLRPPLWLPRGRRRRRLFPQRIRQGRTLHIRHCRRTKLHTQGAHVPFHLHPRHRRTPPSNPSHQRRRKGTNPTPHGALHPGKKSRPDILSQQLRIVETGGADKGFTHRDVTLESWAGLMAGSDSIVSTMNPTV